MNETLHTKYPIILIHGIGVKDGADGKNWGILPKWLRQHGARVHFGGQRAAASIASNAEMIRDTIMRVVAETKCQKVNLIAHSKGGLEARCAISKDEIAQRVASLTTLNTPHAGCTFADFVFDTVPDKLANLIYGIANKYIAWKYKEPADFESMTKELTERACKNFNQKNPLPSNVFCQSFMTAVPRKRLRGKFKIIQPLVDKFAEATDGVVDINSARWGLIYKLYRNDSGVDHADVMKPPRNKKRATEVLHIYKDIIAELQKRGL